ncbi:MAG: radical SAM protein [Bdellovibrionota bacterium]
MHFTSRVDINVGYSCNETCKFCYYIQTVKDQSKDKDLPTQEVKNQIQYIRNQGIQILEFTGGEPTIRNDLVELIQFGKSLGFSSISMITNGLRTANLDYCKQLVEAGLDDILVSIHGHRAQEHDDVTETKGSFEKTLQTIKNFQSIGGVKIRANCVISGFNHQYAVETLALYHSLGIQTANFILFNPIVEADWQSAPELNVAYSDAAPYIQKAIDEYKDKIQKITVRYIPLCLMQGYEKYVTNMPQIQYDPDEWDYVIRTRIREGYFLSTAAMIAGLILYPFKTQSLKSGWNTFKHHGLKYFLQIKNKVYGDACKNCSLKGVCDGVWRKYANWKGFNELHSIPGERVKDLTYFIKNNPNFSTPSEK